MGRHSTGRNTIPSLMHVWFAENTNDNVLSYFRDTGVTCVNVYILRLSLTSLIRSSPQGAYFLIFKKIIYIQLEIMKIVICTQIPRRIPYGVTGHRNVFTCCALSVVSLGGVWALRSVLMPYT